MGLVAHEVARFFSSDTLGINQVLQTLSDDELDLFKKMKPEEQIGWLASRWGFEDELQAFREEMGLPDKERRLHVS